MEEEAVILYALIHGYLDDIEIEKIEKFEYDLFSSMKSNEKGIELAKEIRETKVLPQEDKINSYLLSFKKTFI